MRHKFVAGWIRPFVVFCSVGVINTLISLGVIKVLSDTYHWHYLLANAAGYAVGLLIGFLLHRTITFRATRAARPLRHALGFFLLIFFAAYGLQALLLTVLIQQLQVPHMIAQVIAMGFYTVLSFSGNKLVTFARR